MASYYQILGVNQDATREQIRRAFRLKAKKYHPDINNSADAKADFQKLNEAHQVLIDPTKRRLYDIRLKHGIIVTKVHYRPASARPRPETYKRGVRYAKRKPSEPEAVEQIFDKVLFVLLLVMGLYGILFGAYRLFINPPKNDDIDPMHGFLLGIVFTLLLLLFNKSLLGRKKK